MGTRDRSTLTLLSFVALLALLVPSRLPAADDILVEGEEFPAYGWYNIAGYDILPEYCSGASGYYAADGIDVPGEWIKLKVTFPVAGCYEAVLAYQAEYGDLVKLVVTILDTPSPGLVVSVSFSLDEGYGFG